MCRCRRSGGRERCGRPLVRSAPLRARSAVARNKKPKDGHGLRHARLRARHGGHAAAGRPGPALGHASLATTAMCRHLAPPSQVDEANAAAYLTPTPRLTPGARFLEHRVQRVSAPVGLDARALAACGQPLRRALRASPSVLAGSRGRDPRGQANWRARDRTGAAAALHRVLGAEAPRAPARDSCGRRCGQAFGRG